MTDPYGQDGIYRDEHGRLTDGHPTSNKHPWKKKGNVVFHRKEKEVIASDHNDKNFEWDCHDAMEASRNDRKV